MEHRKQSERPATWRVFEPGLLEYGEALRLQHRFVAARKTGTLACDLLIRLEHPPVFTLGQAGKPEHVLAPGDIPVLQVEMG